MYNRVRVLLEKEDFTEGGGARYTTGGGGWGGGVLATFLLGCGYVAVHALICSLKQTYMFYALCCVI